METDIGPNASPNASRQGKRGQQLEMTFIDESRVLLRYNVPAAEVVTDFYDQVKSLSSGYARYVDSILRAVVDVRALCSDLSQLCSRQSPPS